MTSTLRHRSVGARPSWRAASAPLAIVTSHQLSPVMLIVSLLMLAVVTRKVPLWVPGALAALELWWVVLAWSFLAAHFT